MDPSIMLRMCTVYHGVTDRVGPYVVREWHVVRGLAIPVPKEAWDFPTLEDARRFIRFRFADAVRLVRNDADDPTIVETWV
jgi:hypothetical protein